ncbi:MAG: type II toxin-antitoxin system RelE/ParE family toxin [Bifidobacteriaceae bacterium]|jgi:hypothetical protein|nr:type II toxin-antitoxin system RelE/ParE family toxin [Bifidobacteriaceae bacterium]
MSVPVRIHPEAKQELRQALEWYKAIDPSLASRMRRQVDLAVRGVRRFPLAGAPIFDSYRHVVPRHFPYMLVYRVLSSGTRTTAAEVLAVFHLRRDPDWMERQLGARA